MSTLPAEPRVARPSTQWINPANEIQPAPDTSSSVTLAETAKAGLAEVEPAQVKPDDESAVRLPSGDLSDVERRNGYVQVRIASGDGKPVVPADAAAERPARLATQWIDPANEIQPAAAERPAFKVDERPSMRRRINPLPSAPDEYIDTNTPSCPPTPQYEGPPPFGVWSEGHGDLPYSRHLRTATMDTLWDPEEAVSAGEAIHQYNTVPEAVASTDGGESTGHARPVRSSLGSLCPLPEEEPAEEQVQERGGRRSRRGSSNKTLQICFSRWAAQLPTAIKNKIIRWTKYRDDKWKLAEHTELFALVCCQFGMWFSVVEAAVACEYDRPSVCRPPSLPPPFGD